MSYSSAAPRHLSWSLDRPKKVNKISTWPWLNNVQDQSTTNEQAASNPGRETPFQSSSQEKPKSRDSKDHLLPHHVPTLSPIPSVREATESETPSPENTSQSLPNEGNAKGAQRSKEGNDTSQDQRRTEDPLSKVLAAAEGMSKTPTFLLERLPPIRRFTRLSLDFAPTSIPLPTSPDSVISQQSLDDPVNVPQSEETKTSAPQSDSFAPGSYPESITAEDTPWQTPKLLPKDQKPGSGFPGKTGLGLPEDKFTSLEPSATVSSDSKVLAGKKGEPTSVMGLEQPTNDSDTQIEPVPEKVIHEKKRNGSNANLLDNATEDELGKSRGAIEDNQADMKLSPQDKEDEDLFSLSRNLEIQEQSSDTQDTRRNGLPVGRRDSAAPPDIGSKRVDPSSTEERDFQDSSSPTKRNDSIASSRRPSSKANAIQTGGDSWRGSSLGMRRASIAPSIESSDRADNAWLIDEDKRDSLVAVQRASTSFSNRSPSRANTEPTNDENSKERTGASSAMRRVSTLLPNEISNRANTVSIDYADADARRANSPIWESALNARPKITAKVADAMSFNASESAAESDTDNASMKPLLASPKKYEASSQISDNSFRHPDDDGSSASENVVVREPSSSKRKPTLSSPSLTRLYGIFTIESPPSDDIKRDNEQRGSTYPFPRFPSEKTHSPSTRVQLPNPDITVEEPSEGEESLPSPPSALTPTHGSSKNVRSPEDGERIMAHDESERTEEPARLPTKRRKVYIRKARCLILRQPILDAALGRQIGAQTKPALRRLAEGELVFTEPPRNL